VFAHPRVSDERIPVRIFARYRAGFWLFWDRRDDFRNALDVREPFAVSVVPTLSPGCSDNGSISLGPLVLPIVKAVGNPGP
jgi:hypothetical protein